MSTYFSNLVKHWQIIRNNSQFRWQFIITVVALASILFTLQLFLAIVETRQGAVIDDPILKLFSPIDVTWITFVFIYFGLLTAILYLLQHPRQLLMAITGYSIIVIFRIMAMFSLPLDPPSTMIALEDPFVEFFGSGITLTRDLFFSGHTSIMFLFFLVINKGPLKFLFLFGTAAIAFCVLIQHVHYSVDVFVAFFVAFAAYKISEKIVR